MSDVSKAPGWWQASDGKWYPPETHPDWRPPPAPMGTQIPATPSGGSLGSPPGVRRPLFKRWWIWLATAVVLLLVTSVIAGATTSSKKITTSPSVGAVSSTSAPQASRHASPTTIHRAPKPVVTTSPRTSPPSSPETASEGASVINSAGAVLPNPARTPGAINTNVTQSDIYSTICVSGWTSTVRPPSSYTTGLKEQQLASGYAYRGDTNTSDYEEDHLIPLELGGSPTSTLNLWPEPYFAPDGARTKDQIENKLNALVCDRALTLAAAQHAIASNWFVAYQTYIGTPTSSEPAVTTTVAPPAPTQSSALTCSASMSNSSPSQYSTVDVIVHAGVGGASVTATAHYKSTNTTHTGTAGSNGVASIPFYISRATIGYQVEVDVTVSAAGSTRSCSTSFTPR
jgi:hypothetical protein